MLKKLLKSICVSAIAISCAIGTSCTAYAERVDDPAVIASDYIAAYGWDIGVSSGGAGIFWVSYTYTAFYTDKMQVILQTQYLKNGIWYNHKSFSSTCNGDENTLAETKYVAGTPGTKYRAKITVNAIVDGEVVETRTVTTDSIVAES